jgi:hypothetical protein
MTHRYTARAPMRKRFIDTFRGLKVYLVDGLFVRNHINVDFTMGGTVQRWKFIPDGEIWIDECLHDLDQKATIRHEAKEYYEMRDKGLTYNKAHEKANVVEREYRKAAFQGE